MKGMIVLILWGLSIAAVFHLSETLRESKSDMSGLSGLMSTSGDGLEAARARLAQVQRAAVIEYRPSASLGPGVTWASLGSRAGKVANFAKETRDWAEKLRLTANEQMETWGWGIRISEG